LNQPLRLLVITPETPRPDQSGGDLRLLALVSHLAAAGHRVVIYPMLDLGDENAVCRYRSVLGNVGAKLMPGGWVPGLERALLRHVYDAVLFEFFTTADLGMELVARLQPWAKIIIDTIDIHFRRETGALALGLSDPATVEANKRRELDVYRRAHATVCVSAEDGRFLDAEGGVTQPYVISLVVPERPRSARPRGPELLFLGGFKHSPNVDGLIWFANDVWPSIRSACPAAEITVIGSNPTRDVLDLAGVDGINVVGFVPDVGPYLDRAALMVAPLRFGSGVKTKVLEAMSAGLAVVTTGVGAQGLDVLSGEQLIVADGPGEFARETVDLLRDPERAERIGRAAQTYVAETFSPLTTGRRFEAILSEIVGPTRTSPTPHDRLMRFFQRHSDGVRSRLGGVKRRLLGVG